ncbi:SNF2 family N-terminal domain-domain-containing protein [Coniella lustricola]|uniref:SNF2 family N-terminal domain-domain-containing protein n=1 Tax=Coniella lustricola TaxID=2025994 RepID=A0A2T3A3U8_9PEZI|nr:SNF2 family N-terminal domain-domain-containing protein [Coniella lustricola]
MPARTTSSSSRRDAVASSSSSSSSSLSSPANASSMPSSPPLPADSPECDEEEYLPDQQLANEEKEARKRNLEVEKKRNASLKRKRRPVTKEDRDKKAKELDDLLKQSAAFSDILTKKTQVLGRVGTSLDGQALGAHDLEMTEQPKCLVGGTMRDYQLEGVTWMKEVCAQGMSGILADEMGLGKTIQTIGIIGNLREVEDYLGPHLIIAPLSTLSNWIAEFQKWAPSIPVLMYHGLPEERQKLHKNQLLRNLKSGRPTDKFPVVCTSYEMVIKDSSLLSKINWELIIIDEGHRMKNAESRLFQEVCKFTSATRFLITGTPLQNNLKELWSLLHFLMPAIFTDWEAFETWFDFSDLEDEEGTERFVQDKANHALVKKIHTVLQPLLLRRVKADVAHHLPKKREYVLYAPMTKEQTDLYNMITDKRADTRAYLEKTLFERLTGTTNSPAGSKLATPASSRAASVMNTKNETPVDENGSEKASPQTNGGSAFDKMMGPSRKRGRPANKNSGVKTNKRKAPPTTASQAPTPKSVKTNGTSTPARTTRASGRSKAARQSYNLEESDDDMLSDDDFEAKIAEKYAEDAASAGTSTPAATAEEMERAATLELAKKQIASKALGNPMMQLRLVCNSPLNFYDPFPNGDHLDETIITSSGKMLLLDRLLPTLFERGHKVLIFSQFRTQLDILTDYCTFRNYNYCRIDGSVSQKDRHEQIAWFNASDSDCKLFLLGTRAGGQGINLASADTVILYDSDWNPQQDLQAQDRCHRIGQTRPVIVYRLATKSTIEESLLMSADAKRRLEKLVIRKGTYRTLGQKKDLQQQQEEDLDNETLRHLLLKDGEVFKFSGGEDILSDGDMEILCDRTDAAYNRAAKGAGDAAGYRVVTTGANGLSVASTI